MSHPDALEAALAQVERTYEEQNEALRDLFSRIEELGSASAHVDECELAELTSCTEAHAVRRMQPLALGPRC